MRGPVCVTTKLLDNDKVAVTVLFPGVVQGYYELKEADPRGEVQIMSVRHFINYDGADGNILSVVIRIKSKVYGCYGAIRSDYTLWENVQGFARHMGEIIQPD